MARQLDPKGIEKAAAEIRPEAFQDRFAFDARAKAREKAVSILSAYFDATEADPAPASGEQFALGARVTKKTGSKWTGRVVGLYSTELTPKGYAVESETERGSVQIYPEAALVPAPPKNRQES